eukprot:jgi/Ulvmu1/11016/UM007_0196.1
MIEQSFSQAWLKEAKSAYNERIRDMETEIGECMQECCRRDVKNQVYSSKMNAQLRQLDPSSQATDVRGLLCPPAGAAGPTPATSSELEHAQRVGGLDAALQAAAAAAPARLADERMPASAQEMHEVAVLRQQRMHSMRQQRSNAAAAADAGYGTLQDVSSAAAQEAVAEAPAAVVHLWESGFAADLDEALARLALRFPGTRVVRTPLRHCGEWLRRLRQPQQPLLLAALQGRVAGAISAAELLRSAHGGDGGGGGDESSDFGDSDAEEGPEAAAEGWLRCRRVLRVKPPAVLVAAGGVLADASSEDVEPQQEDEWSTPCNECGRTYPHEHKRAVRKGGCGDSDSGDD